MRNLFTILFAILYLILTSGFVISAHYCHGQFKYAAPTLAIENECAEDEANSCCAKDDFGDQEENCCDEDTYLVYFETDQKPTVPTVNTFEVNVEKLVSSEVEIIREEGFEHRSGFFNSNESPPSGQAIRLSQCSLVFYG